MNEPAPRTTPRETLQGDRLCTQCLHPLLGRAIEREPQTGLLYVRCGECGTASALFEYPTATPWLNRIKAVAASTIVALGLLASLVAAAVTGGFLAGSVSNALDGATTAIVQSYARAKPWNTDQSAQQAQSNYYADETWLASDEGKAAVAAARWTIPAWAMLGLIAGLGSVLATPFLVLIGIALMRLRPPRRVLLGVIPVVLGTTTGATLMFLTVGFIGRTPSQTRAWIEVAREAHAMFFATLAVCWFVALAAVLLAGAPSIAALVARVVLPPRDRRLVAWLWEWRGKPVPRD